MKCPLMSQPYESAPYQSKWHSIDCLKEECAWWDDYFQQCAILRLEKSLTHIDGVSQMIIKKMPHEEQFRK